MLINQLLVRLDSNFYLNENRKKNKAYNNPRRKQKKYKANSVVTDFFPLVRPFQVNSPCHCNIRQVQPIIADGKQANNDLYATECVRTITLVVSVPEVREKGWGDKETKQSITQSQVQNPYGYCGEVFVETMPKSKHALS